MSRLIATAALLLGVLLLFISTVKLLADRTQGSPPRTLATGPSSSPNLIQSRREGAHQTAGDIDSYDSAADSSSEQPDIRGPIPSQQLDAGPAADRELQTRGADVENDHAAQEFCAEEKRKWGEKGLGGLTCQNAGGGWIVEDTPFALVYAHKSGLDRLNIFCTDTPNRLTLGRDLAIFLSLNEPEHLFTVENQRGEKGVIEQSLDLDSYFEGLASSLSSGWVAVTGKPPLSEIALVARDPQERLAYNISRSEGMTITGTNAGGPIKINLAFGRVDLARFDRDCKSVATWAESSFNSAP